MEDIIIRALEDSGFDRVDRPHEQYILTSHLLGKGNYGSVVEAFRKEDEAHWSRVAVKLLKLNLKDDIPTVQLQSTNDLAKEICLSQRAQGEGVTKVFTPWFNSTDGSIYIPMEKMDTTLEVYAREARYRFRPGTLTCIFAQCLQSLWTVHKASVVHRDVKPENFLVRRIPETYAKTREVEVEVKLTDFGLSSETFDTWTLSSNAGTPLYMPPESFISTKSELPAARDVWGLACVFHLLLTGVLPFHGENIEELKKKVIHGKKRIKLLYDTTETRQLAKLTLAMFAIHPKSRPTAEASLKLLLHLHQDCSGHGSTGSKSSSRHSSTSGLDDMLVQYVKYGCRVDPEPLLTAMYACRSNYPVHVYRDPNCQRRVDTIRYGTFVLIDTALGEIDYKPPPSLANSHTDIISPSVEVSSVAPEELIPRTDTGISTSSSGTCEYHTSAVKRNSEHSVTSVVTNYDAILENNRLPWSRIVFPAVGYVQQRTVAGHCLHPISARHTSHDTIYPCEALPLSEGLLRRENTNQLTEDTTSEAPNGSPLPLRIPKTASSKNIPTSAVKLSRFSHKEKYVDAQKHLYSASDTDGLQEDNSLYDTRNSQQQQQRERRTLKEKVFRFIGFGKKSKKELNT